MDRFHGSFPASCCLVSAFLLFLHAGVHAQENDSSALYQRIHDYSQKRKVTRWIYEAIFVAPEYGSAAPAPKTPPRRVNLADRFAGRTVRSIQITVTDPFGYSVDDSARVPVSWLQRGGNTLHRRTRERIVKDLLLVARLDTLDPLRIAESERLLRASPIVTDARIAVVPSGTSRDSVDVLVVVQDKWSIDVSAEGSFNSASATIRDRNLFGLGQQLQQSVTYSPELEQPELSGRHMLYNIAGTYIASMLDYGTSSTVDHVGLSFDRAFYSPLARWAGGISGGKAWIAQPLLDSTGTRIGTQRLNVVDLDSWAGRSFAIANDGTEPGRQSNIIVGVRHSETRFPLRPSFIDDSLRINSERTLSLLGAGFSVRQYYKERYLFRFGTIEDVPEGFLLKATAGFRNVEGMRSQVYTSAEISRGRHFEKVGYMSLSAGYGTYWRNSAGVDATLSTGFFYFSDLVPIKRWHVRQFVRCNVVAGFGKAPYERVDINGDQLYGFSSPSVSGTHKELLSFETVGYAPYSLLGFRFAPVLVWGMGTIGTEPEPLFSGRIYQAFALGVLVRNENLLVRTFEVSLSFYPFMPDSGRNVFEVGSFLDFTLKAPGFSFTRPDVVAY